MNTQKWVLLVEDDSNDAGLAQHVLTQSPSPVIVVHVKDGAEALNCLRRRETFRSRDPTPPALLLLDLKMPRMDGFSVLEQVKRDTDLKTIPVTVFTSSSEPADLARSYELGTNAYVVKPVDFEAFRDVLDEIKDFWINHNEQPPARIPARTAARAEGVAPTPRTPDVDS